MLIVECHVTGALTCYGLRINFCFYQNKINLEKKKVISHFAWLK